MIPKIIHYCWFGGNPLNDDVKRYIDTWRKYCPDYEIIEWDESNFDVNENDYCREAYESKKWAFVTDYVRLKVLYEYGGIYMDTDVEVVKPYDELLEKKFFCCFEDDVKVSIGTFGAEPKCELLGKLLKKYQDIKFIRADGTMDMTTNLKIVTPLLVNEYKLSLNGKYQKLKDDINVYPMEYFIAKEYNTGFIRRTCDTYAIHHFAGSWLSQKEKKRNDIYRKFYTECPVQIEEIAANYARIRTILKCDTYRDIINKIKNKL